jgi:acetyl esterase
VRGSWFVLGAMALGIVLAGPTLGFSAQAAPRVERGIVYASPEGIPLRLDAYLPGTPGPHPAVVLIHGGAWREGDRELSGNWYATAFVDAGFAAFAVDYRLAPEQPYPAAVGDVRAAVAWVRAHAAEYDVEPAAIGAFGDSAGGHLAAMLDVLGHGPTDADSRVAAAVSWSGPMDLAALVRDRGALVVRGHRGSYELTVRDIVEQFLGCAGASCADPLRRASPVTFVDPTDAPMLLASSVDEEIPIAQARKMSDELRRAGVPVTLIELPGDKHAVEYAGDPVPGSTATVLERSIAFLRSELQPAQHGGGGTASHSSGPLLPIGLVALVIACAASALLLPRHRARQARLLALPSARSIRWLPLAPIAAVGYGAIWISFHTDSIGTETHLPYAGFLLAVWLGFVLEDPAAETTVSVPTPLLLRRAVRFAVAMPPVWSIWGVLLVYAHRSGFVSLSLSLNLGAQLVAALALAAVGSRSVGEERAGLFAAVGLVILFFVVPAVMRLPPVSYEPGGSSWMQLYGRSLLIATVSMLVFALVSLDRVHRPRFLARRRHRAAVAHGGVG